MATVVTVRVSETEAACVPMGVGVGVGVVVGVELLCLGMSAVVEHVNVCTNKECEADCV